MAKIPGFDYQSQVDYQAPAPIQQDFSGERAMVRADQYRSQSMKRNLQQTGDVFGKLAQQYKDQIEQTELQEFQNEWADKAIEITRQLTDPTMAYKINPSTGEPYYLGAAQTLDEFRQAFWEQGSSTGDGEINPGWMTRFSFESTRKKAEQMMTDGMRELTDKVGFETAHMHRDYARGQAAQKYEQIIESGDADELYNKLDEWQASGVYTDTEIAALERGGEYQLALRGLEIAAMEALFPSDSDRERQDWPEVALMFEGEHALTTFEGRNPMTEIGEDGQERVVPTVLSDEDRQKVKQRVHQTWLTQRRGEYNDMYNEALQKRVNGTLSSSWAMSDVRGDYFTGAPFRLREMILGWLEEDAAAAAGNRVSLNDISWPEGRSNFWRLYNDPTQTDDSIYAWVQANTGPNGFSQNDIEFMTKKISEGKRPEGHAVSLAYKGMLELFDADIERAAGKDEDEYSRLIGARNMAIQHFNEQLVKNTLQYNLNDHERAQVLSNLATAAYQYFAGGGRVARALDMSGQMHVADYYNNSTPLRMTPPEQIQQAIQDGAFQNIPEKLHAVLGPLEHNYKQMLRREFYSGDIDATRLHNGQIVLARAVTGAETTTGADMYSHPGRSGGTVHLFRYQVEDKRFVLEIYNSRRGIWEPAEQAKPYLSYMQNYNTPDKADMDPVHRGADILGGVFMGTGNVR